MHNSPPKPGLIQKVRNAIWNPAYEEYKRSLGGSTLTNPTDWLMEAFGAYPSTSGESVTRKSTLGNSAMFAGLDFIASMLAQIPLRVVEKKGDIETNIPDHPLVPVLNQVGNPQQTAFEVRFQNTINKELDGNGIAIKKRDLRGNVIGLEPILWSFVNITVENGTEVYYHIFQNHLQQTVSLKLPISEVLHFKSRNNSGFCGEPIYSQQRDTIGQAQAIKKAGSKHFEAGMFQKMGFIYPGNWKEDAKKKYGESFQANHMGVNNMGSNPIIDKGVKPFPISTTPEASQMLESQKFSVADVARILRIPSFVINDNERSTFNNIVELSESLFKYSFQSRIESDTQEMEMKLISDQDRGKIHIEYDTSWLLKGDFKARSEFYKTMWQLGVISINEIRRREGINTIGADGDKRFVPLNFTTLEKAGTEEAQRFLEANREQVEAMEETLSKIKKLNGHALN